MTAFMRKAGKHILKQKDAKPLRWQKDLKGLIDFVLMWFYLVQFKRMFSGANYFPVIATRHEESIP